MTRNRRDDISVRTAPEPEVGQPRFLATATPGTTNKFNKTIVKASVVALVVVLAVTFNLIPVPVASNAQSNNVALVAAQGVTEATPEGDEAVCTTAPRRFAEIAALADAPAGELRLFQLGTPGPEIATPVPPASGAPAGPEVVEAVTAALRELYACMNSGDMLRATALWTDDYLQRSLGGLNVEILTSMATPVVLPQADRAAIVAVEAVSVLDDGRVTALARSEDRRAVHIFVVQADGRYLFDGGYEVPEDRTPIP